jgi:hypothetical protein
MTEERLAELMVKVVDEAASPREREELMRHVALHPALALELDQHRSLKAVSDGWVARLEHDLARQHHDDGPAVRAERAIGLTLLVAGIGVLSGFGLVELFLDPEAPGWLKLGMGMSTAGGITVLGSLIRSRLRATDPYSKVIR